MNIYSTVDGIFVARWVNTDGLSAINITMPMIFLISALGMMFGSGGNALVAKKIGEGKHREAKEDFSLLVVVAFVFSVVLAVLCFLFLDPLCRFLGSDDALLPLCRAYMIPVLVTIPFAIFGVVFQMSYITVGKANLGLIFSLLGGVLNVVLDWLFIAIFHWGIAGAAIATGIGYAVPSLIGVVWFCVKREQALCIVRPKWRLHTLLQSCANGASEMVGVLAFSVVTILFNNILMNLAGSDGVASLTIIWYAQELFSGMFRGYITGVSSVVSYNLGKGDKERLARAFRISIRIIAVAGVAVVAVSCLAGGAVIGFFAKGNQNVYDVALRGFRIVAVSFILMAYNVFLLRLVHRPQRRQDLRHPVLLPHHPLHGGARPGAAPALRRGRRVAVSERGRGAEPADDHLLLREVSQGLDARTRDGRTDGAAIREKGTVSAVPFLRFGLRSLPRQVLRL